MILNTRPEPQATELETLLAESSFRSHSLPLLTIKPLNPKIRADYDIVIVTSRFAVPWCQKNLITQTDLSNKKRLICIGPATYDQLSELIHNNKQQGRFELELPDVFNSEGVIDMLQSENLSDKKIAIIKGTGGRNILEESLLKRSDKVDVYSVYKRIFNISAEEIRRVEEQPITCIIVTSVEIGRRLLDTLDITWLKNRYIIAGSERIKAELEALGLYQITVSDSTSNRDIVKSILDLKSNQLLSL